MLSVRLPRPETGSTKLSRIGDSAQTVPCSSIQSEGSTGSGRARAPWNAIADWLEVLTGAFAGLLAGILSDPLRSWTNRKLKERQMRNALY